MNDCTDPTLPTSANRSRVIPAYGRFLTRALVDCPGATLGHLAPVLSMGRIRLSQIGIEIVGVFIYSAFDRRRLPFLS
jgi:hypothetical protein